MRWFDDLWLQEGFAEFMAYKTLEHVMPQYNAWKAFYERNKQAAYLTDSTKGTTPIYQEIPNLSAAKSAYGNIVYRKAPSFLRQAEFYLGEDKFQTAVRAFLKKHEYANATWQDLVSEFEAASGERLQNWTAQWVTQAGMPIIRMRRHQIRRFCMESSMSRDRLQWNEKFVVLQVEGDYRNKVEVEWTRSTVSLKPGDSHGQCSTTNRDPDNPQLIFPNYQDYGYGIFLLDDKSRDYVLKNIQNEKDDFLRSMMWGSLWDSVREAELDPREYVELAIKNLPVEKDETITASVLGRVSTAMTYYLSEPPPSGGGQKAGASSTNWPPANAGGSDPSQKAGASSTNWPPAYAGGSDTGGNASVNERAPTQPSTARSLTVASLPVRLEAMLIDRMRTAPTLGQRITYYRAFLNMVSTENGRSVLKEMLRNAGSIAAGAVGAGKKAPVTTVPGTDKYTATAEIPLKSKDKFDIVTRLAILNDPDAPKLLADLEKTETSDDAKRYAYAAKAAFPTKETKEKFWNDFVSNKEISENWIEAAFGPFNSPRHADLTLPYLERALAELPNLKRSRKIFFVNGWLGAFIGGQRSQIALDIVNKFLEGNPNLDRDLRLKILENADVIERAVRIRSKFGQS
jgi:hypothetical protein